MTVQKSLQKENDHLLPWSNEPIDVKMLNEAIREAQKPMKIPGAIYQLHPPASEAKDGA